MAGPTLESIYPTLFIGLGGAGGHVLGRLNSLFQQHFGEELEASGEASPLQFLLLDTDDFEKLDDQVRQGLGGAERNFLSLSHFNPRRYAEHQLSITDSDLHRWLDRNALRYLDDAIIHDGASRLRLLGRLCMHYHYERVEQRIRHKIDKALDASVHTRAERIKPEPRPFRVFLVSSSCGGTGSGIFLDVASTVSRIIRDRGAVPDMQSFVYLPFPFIEANAQIDPALEAFYQHNAWAFFEELNYFLDNPERIAEYTLDPDRRLNDLPRPAGDYGMDLFRTVYLIGNYIPTIGTLELGNELHSYVANGIFHTFLTPEEGAVQSHYSNIKAKLKDKDRIFGAVKRFATFGYAEYRRKGEDHAELLVRDAISREWDALVGSEPTPSDVQREAKALASVLGQAVDQVIRDAKNWAPEGLLTGSAITKKQLDRMGGLIGSLLTDADSEQAEKLVALTQAANRSIPDVLRDRIRDRLQAPPSGLQTEIQALLQLRQHVMQRASGLRSEQPIERLSADSDLQQTVTDLRAQVPPTPRFNNQFTQRRTKSRLSTLSTGIDKLVGQLSRRATDRLVVQLKDAIAQLLTDEIDSSLAQMVDGLDQAVALLQQYRPGTSTAAVALLSPTIQEVPPPELGGGREFKQEAQQFYANHQTIVGPRRKELWSQALPELRRGSVPAVAAFHAELQQLWLDSVIRTHGNKGILEWVTYWADRVVESDRKGNRTVKEVERELLSRLVPLSTPACALDRTTLDKADTVPEVVAVVGPFKTEGDAADQLSVRGPCALIESEDGDRLAVLQTWYAFSSRAVEGMETLRRSYLKRDRTNSLPHIHKQWNERGLTEGVDAASRYNPDEVTHVARMLALSRFLRRPDANGDAIPGFTLRRDSRDAEEPYLLEYRHEEGRSALRWRDLLIVDHYDNVLEMPALNGVAEGAPYVNGAGWDLERDLAAYLGAETRQRHAQLLNEIEPLEHSPEYGPEYLQAYTEYLEHLEQVIQQEKKSGRQRHLPMLQKLANALHGYIRTVEETDRPLI